MNVLVTGGCGFVGRNLISRLLKDGHSVTCVDPIVEQTGGLQPADWREIYPLDFLEFKFIKKDCRDFFKENSEFFDEVYHCAAMVGGRLMIENNPLAVAEDLSIDSMMFAWAKKYKPGKIINFSSSAAYPIFLQTKDNYRLLLEDDGKIAYERHGLQSVVFRPFSGYGPTQDLAYPFPSIIRRAIKHPNDQSNFEVWGSGLQMRDFIHIDDCISCIMLTKDQVNDGSPINISTGNLTSFIELASVALDCLGKGRSKVIGKSDKPEGVFARGGDTQLQKRLGFVHTIALLEGISSAIDYLGKF
jgi:GDP-L-fucose synthase